MSRPSHSGCRPVRTARGADELGAMPRGGPPGSNPTGSAACFVGDIVFSPAHARAPPLYTQIVDLVAEALILNMRRRP